MASLSEILIIRGLMPITSMDQVTGDPVRDDAHVAELVEGGVVSESQVASARAAQLGLPFVESRVTLPELKAADELILVGTTTEVVPIIQVDDDPIASGRPGPMVCRLWDAYRQDVERWLAGHPSTA